MDRSSRTARCGRRCEAAPEQLKKGPGFVLYALMDFIVDQYFPIVEALEEQLEQLEEEIFSERVTRDTTNRIYELKRDLLFEAGGFTGGRHLQSPGAVRYHACAGRYPAIFRDVYDHALRVNEMIDNLRELLRQRSKRTFR